MDASVKVTNEAEEAVIMKEIMAVVYFDTEKAYDSGVGLNNWVPDFLSN